VKHLKVKAPQLYTYFIHLLRDFEFSFLIYNYYFNTRMDAHTHARTHIHARTHTHGSTHAYIHTWTHARMNAHT